MRRRKITWEDWSVLPSKERKAIRKPLLKASRKSKPMTCEENKILMIPAPEDEEAIIVAVAAELRNYMKGNFDKAVKDEQLQTH